MKLFGQEYTFNIIPIGHETGFFPSGLEKNNHLKYLSGRSFNLQME